MKTSVGTKMTTVITISFVALIIINCFYFTSAQSVLNIVPGIFSKKTESNGLRLPATSTFQPITTLTTNIHIDKPHSVFVHYQITLESANTDFYSKLLINYGNAGSLVHSGNQHYKTATGFYMANLNPGYYTFEVHYKSPLAINIPASWDWQTAILQVMWFEDAYAVSDGIKCYPIPTTTNAYNNWGPIRDIEAILRLTSNRVVLSAYQLSTENTSASFIHMVTSLQVDGFYHNTASLHKGDDAFLDLHGAWARYMYAGPHYFGIQYRTPHDLSFTDCKEKYRDNKNLYAMMLPSSCRIVAIVNPKTSISLNNSDEWTSTDVTHTFRLSMQHHFIIMYQYTGYGGNSYVAMRLNINSVPQPHTISLIGNTTFAGNFGLWQGFLSSGTHKITLDYRSSAKTESIVSSDLEWIRKKWNKWMNRVMTVIKC